MGAQTGIEWTDHTFNPWIGCTKISPGCAHCYAKTRDDRHLLGPESHWGSGAPRRLMADRYWRQPLQWAKLARAEGRRHKVFTASQADIFDAEAPVSERQRLWRAIGETFDALDWQIVTKRPENILPVLDDDGLNYGFFEACRCWLLVSTEDQPNANKRIPLLLDVPAAVRGISVEPMLGSLNLHDIEVDSGSLDALCGLVFCEGQNEPALGHRLDWVICGGESGNDARAPKPEWIRSLRDQCVATGTPFFFKQWGEWGLNWLNDENGAVSGSEWMDRMGKKAAGALLDGVEHKQFPGGAY